MGRGDICVCNFTTNENTLREELQQIGGLVDMTAACNSHPGKTLNAQGIEYALVIKRSLFSQIIKIHIPYSSPMRAMYGV